MEVALPTAGDEFADRGSHVGPGKPLEQCFLVDELLAREHAREGQILLATGDVLRDGEVVDFQAQAGEAARVRGLAIIVTCNDNESSRGA